MADVTDKQRTDYTEGSVIGSILKMGLPSMFGFLTQHIYILADTYWVSHLPARESAVAATTFVGNILWVMFSFNQLVGPGSVAIISRRYGEKAYDLAEKAIKETLILKLIFGAIFAVAGFYLIRDGIYLIGARDQALALGTSYGRITFIGLPVMFATYSVFTALRGVANPNMALALMLSSNVLNMALDPVLMYGYLGFPALGIDGAALASIISFTVTFAVGIGILYSGRANVRLHLRGKEKITLEAMRKIIRIGLPAWFGDFSFSGSRMIVTRMVAPFGTHVVAAYGVSNQIVGFGIMILVGMGLGLSSLIGHNIGSGKLRRAVKTANQSVLLGIGVMSLLGSVVYIFAPQIMGFFFDAADTLREGTVMLRIFCLVFPLYGAFIMMENIHMGVGLNTPVMVINIVHAWFLTVLPIWVLTSAAGLNQLAIWWSMSLGGAIACILFYFYYRRGRWVTHKV